MRIALDSCSFSRFLEANDGARNDLNDLILKLVMYAPVLPHVPPQVWAEYQKIGDPVKRDWHWRFATSFFLEDVDEIAEQPAVLARIEELLPLHPRKHADCRVLAECEAMRMDVLVTTDCRFLNRLFPVAKVALLSPGMCWERLAISPGTPPVRWPAEGHPLAGTTYWHA